MEDFNASSLRINNILLIKIKNALIIIGIITGIAVLYNYNPEETVWIPKCPFYILTGYQCPSCGIQRAIYNLLHFELYKAFTHNPFLILSVPYGIMLIIVTWITPKSRLDKLKKICYNRLTIKAYLVLMVLWWIIRNIIGI